MTLERSPTRFIRCVSTNCFLVRGLCLFLVGFAFLDGVSAQEVPGVNRLAHPEVAKELGLDDAQRAAIQDLLQKRTAASALTDAAQKKTELAAIDKQLESVLSPDQWRAFQGLGETKKLSFQFRDQKWDDVLSWFARQEGLTLIMDRVPPGSFTYGDTREYTATEAIDLLNSVLSTRGFTLVRRERMLLVLELSESIPLELLPRVTLEQLPGRGRFELVSVMFPLGTRPVETVMAEVKPYLGQFGRAIPLPQSKQLLVVETAGKMQTINLLVAAVPEPKVAATATATTAAVPVFAAYALGNLDAAAALKTVKSLVDSERITVDDRTRVLSAYLIPTQQLAVKEAIEQMILQQATLAPQQPVSYPLQGLTVDAMTKYVTSVAPRAVVVSDPTANRVLITADASDHEKIVGALKAVGLGAAPAAQTMRSYQVGISQASVLSTALKTMLPNSQIIGNDTVGTLLVRGSEDDLRVADEVVNRWRGAPSAQNDTLHSFPLDRPTTDPWLAMATRIVPDAKLWVDSTGKRLLLLGSAADKQRFETLLPQLLTSLPAVPERKLKLYQIEPSQWERLKGLRATMTELFRDLKLVEPTKAGELFVWGTDADQTALTELLEQLRQAVPEPALRWPKAYAVQGKDPTLVVELLRDRFPDLKLSTDASSGRLTILADEAGHRAIAELIARMTNELPDLPPVELKRYDASAEVLAQFAPLKADLEKRLSPLQLTVDAAHQAIWAWGPATMQAEFEKVLAPLQQAIPVERQRIVLAYTLQHADATNVKVLLDQVFKEMVLVADAKRGQLVATGTLADQTKLKVTIDQLDRPAASSKDEVRSYALKNVQAVAVLPALQSLSPRMTLTADATSNRIVATGSPNDHEQLQRSIDRLSGGVNGEPVQVRTYSVPFGDLTTLPAVLAQVAPQAVISSDAVSRTVIVWGTEQNQSRVAEALQQLSRTAESRLELRVYPLPTGRATTLRTSLATLFPTVSVAVDSASNRLIAIAPKEVHAQIAKILESTQEADPKLQRSARRYDLPSDIRAAMVTVIPSGVPNATIVTPATDLKSPIVVLASEEDHARIVRLIDEMKLDMAEEKHEPTARVYTLEKTDPLAFAAQIAELRPNAKIIAGTGTSRLVISDTPPGHEKLQKMLAEFEAVYAQSTGSQLQIYRLKAMKRSQATELLTTALGTKIKLMTMTDPQLLAVSATAADQTQVAETLKMVEQFAPEDDQKIRVFNLDPATADAATVALTLRGGLPASATVQANVTTNSLIAIAPAPVMVQLEAMLGDMQKQLPASLQRQTRIHWLTSSDPVAAVKVLQALLPKATFAADAQARSVAATATTAEHEQIAEFVKGLNVPRDEASETRAYPLKNRDALSLQRALVAGFPAATFAADAVNGEILVTAKASDHKQIAEIIDTLNQSPGKTPLLTTFRIQFSEPRIVASAIQQAFGKRTDVGVSFDDGARAVFVVAMPDETAIARQILEKIDVALPPGPERQLRLFTVKGMDGNSLVESIRTLYKDAHPHVDIRYDQQQEQLIAIAGQQQLEGIDRLLKQFDQPQRTLELFTLKSVDPNTARTAIESLFADQPRSQSPMVSIDDSSQQILVRGTTEQLTQIRELMKKLGENTTTVVPRVEGSRIRTIPVGRDSKRLMEELQKVWPTLRPNPLQVFGADEPKGSSPGVPSKETNPSSEPKKECDDPATNPEPKTAEPQASPIIVIPNPGQWTIASDDLTALDQFEQLILRSSATPMVPAATTGNYSIYLLKHAGAEQMEEVFSSLFKRGASETSAFSRLGKVTVVADPRMNALLVNGSRGDRTVVEELLSVLDSQELIDNLQSSMPRLVALKHTDARRIQDIIREVYRSQLTSGGGRRPLSIPEGVSTETAAVLQQINASAAGPVLTVSIDPSSNSLIIKAPVALADEVIEFAGKLDERANLQSSTRMEIIRLNSINVSRLRQSLQSLSPTRTGTTGTAK